MDGSDREEKGGQGSATPGAADAVPRERLLCVAIDLFTKQGYAATSVREIVEAAGVTKPALYYHFGSKEGIYLELLRSLETSLMEIVSRDRSPAGSTRERIEGLFNGIFDLFESNIAGLRLVNAIFWGPPQGAPPFDLERLHRGLMDAVRRVVDDGIAAGELRGADPADLTLALVGLLSFTMDLELVHPDWGFGKAGLFRLVDIVLAGVSAPHALQEKS